MKPQQHTARRIAFFSAMMVCGLLLLMGRLVQLQVIRHDPLAKKADRQVRRTVDRQPMRGDIRDIRGNPLAISVPAKTVAIDPIALHGRHADAARVLAPILRVEEADLLQRITPQVLRTTNGTNIYRRYVVLQRKTSLEDCARMELAMSNLPPDYTPEEFAALPRRTREKRALEYRQVRIGALIFEDDQIRRYPAKSLAAQMIGATSANRELSGLLGLERTFNDRLTGVPGWVTSEHGRGGKGELSQYRRVDVAARPGENLVLTIDSGVQHILETEMAQQRAKVKAQGITGIVMRPRTGEILAMATHPTFDPNDIRGDATNHFRLRAISDQFEPGSTFKAMVVAAALNEGKVSLEDQIFCENGAFRYGGRTLHDTSGHGMLTVEQIIEKSSNIGSAKIGLMLGERPLVDYIEAFGFGRRTGITLPDEASGMVHRPGSRWWNGLSIVQLPMGHGLAVTPLQMASAMAAIANEGRLMQPVLVDRIEDHRGEVVVRTPRRMVRQVVSPEAAKQMVQALKSPLLSGTARAARVEGFTVAGKTGTAQKPEGGTYSKTAFYSSFIGFLPADEPELLIAIIVDEPAYDPVNKYHQGGKAAAPAFKAVAERAANYLNLKPDLQTNSLIAPVVVAGNH